MSSGPQPSGSPSSSPRSSLERFFRGLVESIFHGHLGVADVDLVDYLSDLLMRFLRTEALYGIRRETGRPATEVVQMLCEADRRIGLAKREVHRHIGDFTLFWSGVYPESLRRLQSPHRPDGFLDYCDQGKRAYRIASEIEPDRENTPSDLLVRLSEQFEMCAFGFREIRRQWEEGDDPNSDQLLV